MQDRTALWGLPDPATEAEFYADVPTKRLVAWGVDTVLTGIMALLLSLFTGPFLFFVFPFMFFVVNLIYRVTGLHRHSATLGMRFTAIEFRTRAGERFDSTHATLHTLVYLISTFSVVPQVISVILMLNTARAQGLGDMLLGTAAINRSARS